MSSTEETFEAILADFKRRLTKKEEDNFKFTTLKDVAETAMRVQRDQETLMTMVHMGRIKSFLEAIDQFGKVIEVFVNAFGFIAFVWGPLKFILQTASTFADSFEVLVDAYGQLGEHMPLLLQHIDLFGSNPDMRRVLALIYSDILLFHRKAIRFFTGKASLWKALFRSLWKDFGAQFNHILKSLSQHRQLIVEQAQLLHFQQYQADRQASLVRIQQYEQDMSEQLMLLKRQEEAEMHRKYLAVLEWFSGAQSTLSDHEIFCQERAKYPGTGDWILKHEKVQNWMELDTPVSSVLWVNGIPGAGKTILASAIVDSCLNDTTSKTAYFYCKEDDLEKNDCISIFRGLLRQILNQCHELLPYCYDKIVSSGEGTLTTTSLAERLLRLFFEKIDRQYIIIDGLDECSKAQRKLVLSFFVTMVDQCDEHNPGKLRILFVSQYFSDIEKALRTAAVLKLTAEDNKNDIQSYVRHWCMKIQRHYTIETQIIEDIQESTCIRSNGMFLFAELVMKNLYAQGTQENLLKEINVYGLPSDLGEAYKRIISRMKRSLEPAEWIIACRLLGWMVCAKRSLKWHEIKAAYSINPDNQSIDFEGRGLRSHIQEYCGSLIQVLPGDRVELVHTTAKIYITRSGYIHKNTIECSLTSLCLRYLTFECFDRDIKTEKLQDCALEGDLSFQDYAIAKWMEHIRAVIEVTPNDVSVDADSQASLQTSLEELGVALGEFVDWYEEDILHSSIGDVAKEACESFQEYPFYGKLLAVWNHTYLHYEKGPQARNDVSIKSLGDVLSRNRKLLENLPPHTGTSSWGEITGLTAMYGDKRFKCPKVTCFYFHEGFKDARSRDRHINRHNRPFSCDFPDCSIAEFGFVSNKDLEKHGRFFHPEIEDQATFFSAAPKPPVMAKWECNICSKRFTRNLHLRSHLRNHSGDRPYACSECGKAFTRGNDCKRHEKIHERR